MVSKTVRNLQCFKNGVYSVDINIKFETENNAGMTFIDKYGNESHLSGDSNNVYTLNLGIDPCYLRGNVTSFLVQ